MQPDTPIDLVPAFVVLPEWIASRPLSAACAAAAARASGDKDAIRSVATAWVATSDGYRPTGQACPVGRLPEL